MIKLEDLKVGDKVYGVCSDGLGIYAESIVKQELFIIDGCESVWSNGGIEVITRSYEPYLFRTQIEAEDCLKELQIKLAKELLKRDEFIDRLFECATSSKRLSKYSEYPIYKIAIDLYKKELKRLVLTKYNKLYK